MKTLPQPQKRAIPSVWVTTLAQLLAEENTCHYAPWLRSQHHIPSPPGAYDSAEHDRMVVERANELRGQGYQVAIEGANSLKVLGKKYKIWIAGRPDIIAVNDQWILVEDCKSGKQRNAHFYQVLLYLMLFPYASQNREQMRSRQLLGRLVYCDETQDISPIYLDIPFYQHLHQTLTVLTSDEVPAPEASAWNCRYCPVPAHYCSAKLSA